jgi:hypothetical protein
MKIVLYTKDPASGPLRGTAGREVKPLKAFTFLNTSDNKELNMHLYRYMRS